MELTKCCKHYVLPADDVKSLPIPSVSAEDLCKYLLNEISIAIRNNDFQTISRPCMYVWMKESDRERAAI